MSKNYFRKKNHQVYDIHFLFIVLNYYTFESNMKGIRDQINIYLY